MSDKTDYSCCNCSAVWQKKGETNCWSSSAENTVPQPGNCPSLNHSDLIKDSYNQLTGNSDDAKMANIASRVEGMCYQKSQDGTTVNARWTRVEDTIAFAKLMGYKKIGIATCIGLLDETRRLSDILDAQDFKPLSVCCKTGSIDKLKLGLEESDKIRPSTFEPACNPIAQALLMNKAKTDMNIIVGLCIGHDIIFTLHSDAPVTTLVVKDRVTGHNPVSVLYGQNFYYKRLQTPPAEDSD